MVFLSGQTEGISEMASIKGIQQQGSRELKGTILSGSGGNVFCFVFSYYSDVIFIQEKRTCESIV